jgi:hypothetical protein
MIYLRSYDLPCPIMLDDFTDLLPAIAHESHECPRCDTALRLNNGLCLLCLLQAGLTEDEDSGSESLEALLSEIE